MRTARDLFSPRFSSPPLALIYPRRVARINASDFCMESTTLRKFPRDVRNSWSHSCSEHRARKTRVGARTFPGRRSKIRRQAETRKDRGTWVGRRRQSVVPGIVSEAVVAQVACFHAFVALRRRAIAWYRALALSMYEIHLRERRQARPQSPLSLLL